jgi:DNA-directed RNA polymerase specialized sigma24 family protein
VVQFGFGPDDVAAALDISYGNAKVVVHRARARLRAAMEHAARPAA